MKRVYLLASLLWTVALWAQKEDLPADSSGNSADTLNLSEALRHGTIHGHARYFYMTTRNHQELSDYYAHAAGGGLRYESALFRGFKVGVSGSFIYNLSSSDFSRPDPYSGQYSRYEIGLFDVEHPHHKTDIGRLEELYLKYAGHKGSITLGKQSIQTPFINPQDGRMRPTETEGLYGQVKWSDKFRVEGGWIYKISPRSTAGWYSVRRSIGINAQGVNPDGSRGNYAGNIESKGVGLLGLTFRPSGALQLKAFEQLVENVFHTTLLQADFHQSAGGYKWSGSLQYIHQGVVHEGGNPDPAKSYFNRQNRVHILGIRAGVQKSGWQTTLNYTRIFKGGRFTTPREWGLEPLFTALPRERNEGAGDVHALMLYAQRQLLNERLKLEAGYGHYYLPAFNKAALNKYGLPSYCHIKLLGDYKFTGDLKGLDLALLFVYKGQLGAGCKEEKYLINKVGMLSYNVILNYTF